MDDNSYSIFMLLVNSRLFNLIDISHPENSMNGRRDDFTNLRFLFFCCFLFGGMSVKYTIILE